MASMIDIPLDPNTIRARLRSYERKLAEEKKRFGAYDDGAGKRYIVLLHTWKLRIKPLEPSRMRFVGDDRKNDRAGRQRAPDVDGHRGLAERDVFEATQLSLRRLYFAEDSLCKLDGVTICNK